MPLAGCSTSGQWQAVTLDAAPTALAPLGTGLLIGTAGPALAGPAGAIAVTTSTPYGNEANWVSLATHGERWRPWRSVATWYLWRSLDPVPVEY